MKSYLRAFENFVAENGKLKIKLRASSGRSKTPQLLPTSPSVQYRPGDRLAWDEYLRQKD